jgi:hypothetical protein
MEQARSACRALSPFGLWAGRGLAVIGALAGLLQVIQALAAAPAPGLSVWAGALLRAGLLLVVCSLAGWAVFVFSRLTAASILGYLEQFSRGSEVLATQAARTVVLLERIAQALGQRSESGGAFDRERDERARLLAAVREAIRTAEWDTAETLLRSFEAEYPGDPRLHVVREELATGRQSAVQDGLAQLEAARSVSDPDRVLELYQTLAPLLAADARGLASELAAWFLNLIQRRLRTGKIQPDLVRLAGRFADAFASTGEGASVRAALPTLRRSVGLCPRCAEAYTGVAEACPKCLGRPVNAASRLPPAPQFTSPESVDSDPL